MKIALSTQPDPRDVAVIRSGLDDYSRQIFPELPGVDDDLNFTVIARDGDKNIVAGLVGSAYWNAMHIALLWVDDRQRGKQLGSQLLARAETLALESGYGIVHLDTVNARDFYIKNGYEVFGELTDQPRGESLYFMQKRLTDVE